MDDMYDTLEELCLCGLESPEEQEKVCMDKEGSFHHQTVDMDR